MSLNFPTKISKYMSPVNLATNGNFTIDQRGDFSGSFSTPSNGDYICDCWFFAQVDPSECYAKFDSNSGLIYLKGYASAGDIIILDNKDNYSLGKNTDIETIEIYGLTNPRTPLTSIVEAIITTGKIRLGCRPRFNNSYSTTEDVNSKTVYTKNNNVFARATRTIITAGNGIDWRSAIYVEFLEDCEFDVTIISFKELLGQYQDNPPEYACISDAAYELQRCKKFYQTGTLDIAECMGWIFTVWFVWDQILFSPKMISTPSISTSFSGYVTYWRTSTAGGGYFQDIVDGNYNIAAEQLTSQYANLSVQFETNLTNYQLMYATIPWIAEVS